MNNNKTKKGSKARGLIQGAQAQGTLSKTSAKVLAVPDLGQQIQAGLGVAVEDVPASEAVLVTMMPDDSGSIRFSGNADAVRTGHNLVIDSLCRCKQSDDVLVHTRYLNGDVLYPYTTLDGAARMDPTNYDPVHGTPLYDQAVVLLATVLAKSQEFADHGVPVRTVTLLITDGADAHSCRADASHVRALVEDMLRTEMHVVAGMGIDDGATDFRQVFRDMGIPERWILTPGNTASEIRAAFQVFSQSAVQASQAAVFSPSAMGGFVN